MCGENLPKKRFYGVTRPDMGEGIGWISPDIQTIVESEIEDSEVGEIIQIKILEMTEAEYHALPEFEGW